MEGLIAATLCGGCLAFGLAAAAMAAVWPDSIEAIAVGMFGSCYLWFICHGVASIVMLRDNDKN